MGFETSFEFAHKLAPGTEGQRDLLGPLRGFVGQHHKRTWKGKGFNLIWRPNHGQSGIQDFFLELNLTQETLEFTNITGTGVANRGFLQKDIALGALAYLQQISDKAGAQHFEPGVWANVPATVDPTEKSTIVRMGSIPHGATINLQGVAFSVGTPVINPASITPFQAGSLDDGTTGLIHFPEEKNVTTLMPSRTTPANLVGLDDSHLADPNKFLSDVLATQQVLSTTVLVVTSDVTAPKSPANAPPDSPDTGGGADNIAFLAGTGHGPNAKSARVTATFWIERVKGSDGEEFDQLQYTQRVLLNFNGLSWPHVSVATLR